MALSEKNKGSMYLTGASTEVKQNPKKPLIAIVAGFIALLAVSFLFTPGLLVNDSTGSRTVANLQASAEGGPACSKDMGTAMGQANWRNWFQGLPAFEDDALRVLTVNEAFGGALTYASYNGEGKGDFMVTRVDGRVDKANEQLDHVNLSTEQQQKLEQERSFGNCLMRPLGIGSGSGLLNIAHFVSSVSGFFAKTIFTPGFICSEPGNPNDDNCVDLLGTIGGFPESAGPTVDANGNVQAPAEGGLIGSLTNSVYLPLLSLVAIVAAISIAYKGIVQRKLRESFFQFIWVVSSVVVGLMFLLNPWLLAKAPMSISNTISGCVILSFSGENCVGDSTPKPNDENTGLNPGGDICRADADASPEEVMELVSISLTCSIWKAFVLEPYAQGSFGQSLEAMDTKNPGVLLKSALDKNEEGLADSFCLSTRVNGAMENHGSYLQLSNPNTTSDSTICNVVVYQLFLKTKAEGAELQSLSKVESGVDEHHDNVDLRWYNVIDVISEEDELWGTWVGGVGNKFGVGLIAIIAAALGGFVIIVVSLFALLYYVSAIMLMAFAPLFFLVGVHPGRGRDILKGYGEIVISNVLKYIASALFLVVTLALYGGVLGSSSSLGMTLLFVIVLTVALLLYRKEIVELIGKVNMGGQQLSNKLGEYGKDVGRFGVAVSGSAVGAAHAGESFWKGTKDGIAREAKAGRIPIGGDMTKSFQRNVAQTAADVGRQNEEEQRRIAAAKKEEARDQRKERTEAQGDLGQLKVEHEKKVAGLDKLTQEIIDLRTSLDSLSPEAVLADMAEKSQEGREFAEAARLQSDIDSTDADIATARKSGASAETIAKMESHQENLRSMQMNIYDRLDEGGHLEGLMDEYHEKTNTQAQAIHSELLSKENEYDSEFQGIVQLEGSIQAKTADVVNKTKDISQLEGEASAHDAAGRSDFGKSKSKRALKKTYKEGTEDIAQRTRNDAMDKANELGGIESVANSYRQSAGRTAAPVAQQKMVYAPENGALPGTEVLNPPRLSHEEPSVGLPGTESLKVEQRRHSAEQRYKNLFGNSSPSGPPSTGGSDEDTLF